MVTASLRPSAPVAGRDDAKRDLRLTWAMIGLTALSIASLAAVCSKSGGARGIRVASVQRQTIAPGIEMVTAALERGGSEGGSLHALYLDPKRARTSVLINGDKSPLEALAPDALAVVNAGFFTPEWRATGLLVTEGKTLSRFVSAGGAAGSGVVVVEDGRPLLLEREKVGKRGFDRASLAIQAGPRVIENGGKHGIRSDDGMRAHRTVIGADQRGRLAIAVVLGPGAWNSGPTLFELQSLLSTTGLGKTGHRDLAFAFALNLDGGPSSGLHVRHREHGFAAPEASPVYSALVVGKRP